MRLLFDLAAVAPWKSTSAHGGGAYGKRAYQLVAARAREREDVEVHVVLWQGQELDANITPLLPESARRHTIYAQQEVVALLEREHFDRFYSPVPYYLSQYAERLGRIRTELRGTIHGTRYLELGWDPIGYYYRVGLSAKLRHAAKWFLTRRFREREILSLQRLVRLFGGRVLAVSDHTRSVLDLISDVPETDIAVAQLAPGTEPLGDPPELSARLRTLGLERDSYFLTVSSNRVEKNAVRVLFALRDHIPKTRDGLRFVLAGAAPSTRDVFTSLVNTRHDVIVLDYLDPSEYLQLIANAYALLYPSLSEGFGYPPLEVMRYGKPAIVSGTTAMPTIYRSGVLFVDPRSPLEIAARVNQLATDRALYERLAGEAVVESERLGRWLRESEPATVEYILS